MVWSIVFSKTAEKHLAQVNLELRRRIIEKLEWLGMHFDNIIPESLTGEFSDFFKLRVGDWRIFYRVAWNIRVIVVHRIVHRSKAYKG